MSGARACADEPDAKRARTVPKEPPAILYPASKAFKGLSLPDLPRELQSEILTLVTQVVDADGDCKMKVRCKRLALLRCLGKQLSYALLSKMCTAAFHAGSNKRKKWRSALEADTSDFAGTSHQKRCLVAQLANFFNRDVLIAMLMRTYDNEYLNIGRANGSAAFKTVQIMFKIHDVENRHYHECLQAIENEQPLPVFQPAQSQEWKELYQSFCA